MFWYPRVAHHSLDGGGAGLDAGESVFDESSERERGCKLGPAKAEDDPVVGDEQGVAKVPVATCARATKTSPVTLHSTKATTRWASQLRTPWLSVHPDGMKSTGVGLLVAATRPEPAHPSLAQQ